MGSWPSWKLGVTYARRGVLRDWPWLLTWEHLNHFHGHFGPTCQGQTLIFLQLF